jgi:Zn-dependent protease/predicted transcriptional regulator
MRMQNWQIGRLLGIPIKVHISWFVIFGFVTWSLATGYLPDALPGQPSARYWIMGGVAALLLFASVVLHELGHSYVALRYRIPIGQITLFIFGGVAQMRREPPGPRAEFLIAIAGPIVSFVLGALLLGMAALNPARQGLVALGILLGSINIQLGLFNLIPGFPLDGGRVLRAGLWAWSGDFFRATRLASVVGQGFGLAFASLGAVVLFGAASGWVPSVLAANGGWIILLGTFLFAAARGSRRQAMIQASLARERVDEVMIRDVIAIEPDLSIDEAVNQYFIRYGYDSFPVTEGGQFLGMVSIRDIQHVPHALWPWRRVRDVMAPRSPSMEVPPHMTAVQALEQMLRDGQSDVAVVEDGRLIGLLTRPHISRLLQLRGVHS